MISRFLSSICAALIAGLCGCAIVAVMAWDVATQYWHGREADPTWEDEDDSPTP